MNKVAASIMLGAATLTGVAGVAADKKANPYTENQQKYEVAAKQNLPEAGEAKIELMKSEPKVVLSKFNNEVKMGVQYNGMQAKGARAFLTNRVEWKGDKEEVHAYPLPADKQMDSGVEIEVVLSEKPAKNTFDFTVDGAENLDFFYQPPLTEEQLMRGDERPENVVGSYAVYYKDHRNHIEGETNYGTGKAYHIFRPKAVDANGEEAWGELSYANGTLTVTVPQDFLDTAVYPVKVDPTFGYLTNGATSTTVENTVRASNDIINEAGTVTSMTAYTNVTTNDKLWRMAVYNYTTVSDAGTLVQSSDEGTALAAGGTVARTLNFTTQPLLTASTNYFLAEWSESASGVFTGFYDSVVGFDILGEAHNYGATNAWTSPMAESSADAGLRLSIYATYSQVIGNCNTPVKGQTWYINKSCFVKSNIYHNSDLQITANGNLILESPFIVRVIGMQNLGKLTVKNGATFYVKTTDP